MGIPFSILTGCVRLVGMVDIHTSRIVISVVFGLMLGGVISDDEAGGVEKHHTANTLAVF